MGELCSMHCNVTGVFRILIEYFSEADDLADNIKVCVVCH